MNTDRMYCITDFGSKAGDQHMNTEAIQNAIDTCSENGGGTIVVPSGIYMSGSIKLKSNITFLLEQGAILRASGNILDYPDTGFHHNEFGVARSFIYAIGNNNIRVTGEGKIDLSSHAFMDFSKVCLFEVDERELNEIQRNEAVVTALARPNQPIFFHDCNNLRFDGITIINSPCWTITFSNCNKINVHHLSIDNHLQVPNCDGIHFSACSDAVVTDCFFSCGDDCIAITGITQWKGISERIVIANCTMRSRSAAVRIGHLASKVRNIILNNLIIHGTNRGLAFFAGDGGSIENIIASNIHMDTAIYAGAWWGKGEPLVICTANSTGTIKNVSVTNVIANSENGVFIVGKKGSIQGVTLRDWKITIKYGKNRPLLGKMIDLQPSITKEAQEGSIPWLYIEEVSDILLNNIQFGRDTDDNNIFDVEAYINKVNNLEQISVKRIKI